MTQQNPGTEEERGWVRRSISLPPLVDDEVVKYAKTTGIDSFSIALRVIITRFMKDEADRAQLLADAQQQRVPTPRI